MHMVDSVGMSFLNWGSDYFSLPVSEIFEFFSVSLCDKLLPASGTDRKVGKHTLQKQCTSFDVVPGPSE